MKAEALNFAHFDILHLKVIFRLVSVVKMAASSSSPATFSNEKNELESATFKLDTLSLTKRPEEVFDMVGKLGEG